MIKTFINRPILSTVIAIILILLGGLGLLTLPVEQYPDIAPPTVQVTATYIGANAETVLRSVVTPLEEAINGVENMTYMTSTSSNDGAANITIFFELGTDPDIASVQVQNRVAKATSLLPAAVIQNGVTTVKSQNSALMFVSMYSDNNLYDEAFLQNYLRIQLLPKIQRINGVGEASVFGDKSYSMRIWLDPKLMASYKVMPVEVQNALREQNLEVAAGSFGENTKSTYQYVIKYKGRLTQQKEYEDIIIKSDGKGNYLRLKDVARIELGSFNYSATNTANLGKPGAIFGVFQTTGSNARDIIDEVIKILKDSEPNFPKGVKYDIPFNSKDFLDASLKKVVTTLFEAFFLVFLVVFIFLQNIRSTIIPLIAVPVAIIGTFFFLKLFGFSVNMLTLFGLVLAIGIVVDDAIVVVEAVHAEMENNHLKPREATLRAMSQISGAIISITLVMVAVFVPVMLISGSAGLFYTQFAVTLCISILISSVNALSLSPALSALFLKDQHVAEKRGFLNRFFAAFNTAFTAFSNKYITSLRFFIKYKWVSVAILVVSSGYALYLFKTTPTGFIPPEDRGNIFVDITLPPGYSLAQTTAVLSQYDSVLKSMDYIISSNLNIASRSILQSINGPSYALSVLKLKDWSERTKPEEQVGALITELYKKTRDIKDARFVFFSPPSVRGFGNSDGFSFQFLDNSDGNFLELDRASKEFVGKLSKRPEIARVVSSFNPNFPQYEVSVNIEKVKDAGLSLNDVFSVLQIYYGGSYTTDFNRFGKQYKVMIQAEPSSRMTPQSLDNMYIRNSNNESVSISEFLSVKRIYGPEVIFRYNLLKSVSLQGSVAQGYSTGEAIKAIQETEKEMPRNYSVEFTGLSREEIISGNQAIYVFLLSLLFVYLFLSAQYESFILPFAVLFCLPLGVMGAIWSMNILGLENNIYFQVALIMLIGLLSKNAILIVEYAIHRRKEGMSLVEAAIEGAKERLRPILMTAFACIFGLLPLALSSGIGSVGNRSIGTGSVGGMLIGTMLGIMIIPFLFVVFQYLHEKNSSKNNA